jgi:6-phosphogluconolactonase
MLSFKLAALATLLPLAAVAMSAAARGETFAYVGNAESNDITVLMLSDKGEMSVVETVPFPGVTKAGGSTPLAVSPDRRFLYAGVRSEPFQVLTFAIDGRTGRLSSRGSAPLADSMANIATDRSGKFLFSASYGGNKVALNPVQANGVVAAPAQEIPTGLNAHAVLPAPDNRFVFATNLGSDQVLSFTFDASSGALAPNAAGTIKTPEKSGPRHFIFHPNGKFIYLLHELNADLAVYAYDAAKGTWREEQRTSVLPPGFSGKPWAADLHVTADGRFLYASERTSNTLVAFKIDAATGHLTTIGSVPTETQPRGFNIDPSGRYLAAVGEVSNGMTVYGIDAASGALEKVKSYAVGKKPNWVEFVSLP